MFVQALSALLFALHLPAVAVFAGGLGLGGWSMAAATTSGYAKVTRTQKRHDNDII